MKVFITGAGGMLASDLRSVCERRGWQVEARSRSSLDVTDQEAVRLILSAIRPDIVLHCAAYTAVDRAEKEPEVTNQVNVDGARNVALASTIVGARMVYFSTDFVFDGTKGSPYVPDDPTNPLSVYGASKRAGELVTLEHARNSLVVRTGWLFGSGGKNFVSTVLRHAAEGVEVRVVDDQSGGPTWTADLAEAVAGLLESGVRGVFHAANSGVATWHELASEALKLKGYDAPSRVSTTEWGAAAPRPAFSALDLTGTEICLGRVMPHWRNALQSFLKEARV